MKKQNNTTGADHLTMEPEQEKNTILEQSLTDAQETESKLDSGKILDRKQCEDTPFQIVNTDSGAFIAIGNQRISDLMTVEECKKMVEEKTWGLICTTIAIITERVMESIQLEDKARNELYKNDEAYP